VASAWLICPRAAQYRGPVEQGQEFEDGALALRYGNGLFGEVLGGVEVAAFQGKAGQGAQVVHSEEVLIESQPPGVVCGGVGSGAGVGEVAGLEPGQCLGAGQ